MPHDFSHILQALQDFHLTTWKLVGYTGMLLFTSRWFVQLYYTRKYKRVVMPLAFWWLSVLGSVLLLMRTHHAVTAFIVSLAGLAGSTLYQQTMEMPEWLAGQPHLIMSLVIWAALLAQFAYAWVMRRRGLLR